MDEKNAMRMVIETMAIMKSAMVDNAMPFTNNILIQKNIRLKSA